MTEEQWAALAQKLVDAVNDLGTPSIPDWISAGSAFLTLVVAVVAVFYAKRQLKEASDAREQTKALELEKSQPYVVAYLDENVSGPETLDLVVKNFGQTAARNVRLNFEPVLKMTDGNGGEMPVRLPVPIPFLAPGQEWRTLFDLIRSRVAQPGLPKTYSGSVTYEGVNGALRSNEALLDIEAHASRLFIERYSLHEAVHALREIRDTHQRWTEGVQGSLSVYVRDGDVKDARRAAERERAQEFARQQRASASEPTRRARPGQNGGTSPLEADES